MCSSSSSSSTCTGENRDECMSKGECMRSGKDMCDRSTGMGRKWLLHELHFFGI